MNGFDSYIEKNLVQYIKKELEYGYSFEAIKHALYQRHNKNLIDSVISRLAHEGFKQKRRAEASKDINEDMFNYLTNLIIEYIQKQQKKGFKLNHIKEALKNYGHSELVINASIEAVLYGKEPEFPYRAKPKYNVLTFLLIAFLGITGILAYTTQESIANIIIGFFPIGLTLLFMFVSDKILPTRFTLVAPVIFVGIFAGLVFASNAFTNMEAEKLLVVNLIGSFIIVLLSTDYTLIREQKIEQDAKERQEDKHRSESKGSNEDDEIKPFDHSHP